MKETGIVHTVVDDEVSVKLKKHAACSGCRACSVNSGGEMVIKAVSANKVEIGDKVTVEIDSTSFLKAVVMVYLFPTIAFLIGILAGLRIASLLGIYEHKEVFSISIGTALLFASFFLTRKYGIRRKENYRARII